MREYRYNLHRSFNTGAGMVLFVMLNPSTATDDQDDPTIRRCSRFARDNGFAELSVVNLFAMRATRPIHLRTAGDAAISEPEYPRRNDVVLMGMTRKADSVVVAWGAHPFARARVDRFLELTDPHKKLLCLGTTKDGSPRHPLYVRADQPFVPWRI